MKKIRKVKKQMNKIKIVFILIFILNILLYNNFVYAEEQFHTIKDFYIGETETEETKKVKENIFPTGINFPNNKVETDWFNTIEDKALNYDEILYQVIALDFEQAEQIIVFRAKAEEELNKQLEHIYEQKVLAQRENPTVTIEEVNNLIDEYNKNCTEKIKEIEEKNPKYNESNWKELQNGNRMVFTDTTGKTAYLFIYAKVTDSDFKEEKTKYIFTEYDLNYEYFKRQENSSSSQGTDNNTTTNTVQKEEQNPTENSNKNNDGTVAPTKLPKARFNIYYNTNNNIATNIRYNFL